MEPKKLSLVVRGDLDWIVMKAMDKERDRRYQTASELVQDIRRYLADDVVEACPPSTGYRMQKFAQRHRALLASVATVVAVLLIGLVATSTALIRAIKAERQAELDLRRARMENSRSMHLARLQER